MSHYIRFSAPSWTAHVYAGPESIERSVHTRNRGQPCKQRPLVYNGVLTIRTVCAARCWVGVKRKVSDLTRLSRADAPQIASILAEVGRRASPKVVACSIYTVYCENLRDAVDKRSILDPIEIFKEDPLSDKYSL